MNKNFNSERTQPNVKYTLKSGKKNVKEKDKVKNRKR